MLTERMFLLCLLLVVPIFIDVAECKPTDFEGTSLESWQQTAVDFDKAYDLVSQLDDNKNDSSSDWLGICHDLSDDLEKSWNLTVRVTERSVAVAWNMGGALYDLINCQPTLLSPIHCIMDNLEKLRKILNPTIPEAYGFIKEGVALVPLVIKDARQCYNL
uniref:Uncharacterized protein n=1 Tax=Lygus hesperus TaxID=30085 RepID=A0A146MCM8_LYGHE